MSWPDCKRKTGLEPATSTLARWSSTTELLSQLRRYLYTKYGGKSTPFIEYFQKPSGTDSPFAGEGV